MNPRAILRLLRPHHCVKNVLVLCPLFFHGELFSPERLPAALAAFAAFSCVASAVYALNDCLDARRDRLHPTKRFRPVASGDVSRRMALLLAAGLCMVAVAVGALCRLPWECLAWGGLYLSANLAYSLGLKDRPVLDVALLASGFLIRVMFGAAATGVAVSHWLYLTVLAGAFYLGLGKRRNELRRMKGGRTRRVLRFYSVGFLERNMTVCMGLSLTFYALWGMAQGTPGLVWTVPLALIILMRYALAADADADGDPVEVLLHDPFALTACALYALTLLALLYLPGTATA